MHNYTGLTASYAKDYYIPIQIVDAIVMVESGGNPAAWNPEQHYRWFWNVKTNTPFRAVSDAENNNEYPPKDFPCLVGDPDQEWWAQQASWGLMQLMGAVARERGFKGLYIPEILDPGTNIRFGCIHLAAYYRRWGKQYGWWGVVGAYNAGSPQATDNGYITKIERYAPSIRSM